MKRITKIFEDLIGQLETFIRPHTKGKKKGKATAATDSNVDFLQNAYITAHYVIHYYDDFESLGENREKFNELQKRFLGFIFELAICKHYCVVPIVSWTIFTEESNNDDDFNDILQPLFSIKTKKYKEGNLYNYMAQWKESSKFDTKTASIILYGIASAFNNIQNNGYSISNLSPRNVYLQNEKIKVDDEEINVLKPLVGDLGQLDDRVFDDPVSLMPDILIKTDDQQIMKFLVSLYFLFQKPTDEEKSIIKDFYGFNIELNDFVYDDKTNNKIIGNAQSFLSIPELYIFNEEDTKLIEEFQKAIAEFDKSQFDSDKNDQISLKTDSDLSSSIISSSFHAPEQRVDIKMINKAISDIQMFKDTSKSFTRTVESRFSVYFPVLAVAYASGDLESYPNLCHAAYFACLADYISSSKMVTSFLTKFSTLTYKSEAEKLFHEGEVFEGNGYALSEEQEDPNELIESKKSIDVNQNLTTAANKYKESAKLGFDKAKTRLAMLIINAASSSEEDKTNAFNNLLLPAAKTDPMAMFEVGMHYLKKNNLTESLKFLGNAYSYNHPDSAFQLARLHHKIATEKMKDNEIDAKDEIVDNLKKAIKFYNVAAKLYDNKVAASTRDALQQFLSKNNV